MSKIDEDIAAELESNIPAPTWPRVVTLQYPIDFGKERVTALEFRRPRIGDMKNLKLGETVAANDLVLIASRLCGKPVALLDMLDAEDAGEVFEIALGFFEKCLEQAGKTRSR